MKLGRILIDRYVCPEWKRQLPLIVASIGGDTASHTATLKAIQPRPRKPSELKVQKLAALDRNPNLTWKQLLLHLQRLEVVVDWDDSNIHWLTEDGGEKTTPTGTFQKWKSD